MPIKVTCSNCGGVLHAPDDAGGKRGRCPTCGNILPIPAVGGTPSPAAAEPPPRPAPRASQGSFGDIALGDKPTPAGRPAPAAPPPEPRRQSATLPPPPADDRPAKKAQPTSPFTKPGSSAGQPAEVSEGVARAWRKASGGLWWVRLAAWLFLVPIVGLNGLRLYEHFTDAPLAFGGFLKQEWLPPAQELDVLVFGVPVFLGLLFLVFGRLGFSGVPRKSGARGLALFAALATLTAFGGLIALLFPPLSALFTGVAPPAVNTTLAVPEWQLFIPGDSLALIQRFGLTVGITAFLVAEFWFVGALGRAASALDNRRFGGRVTRFTLLMGLAAAFLLATGMVRPTTTETERSRAQALSQPQPVAPKVEPKPNDPPKGKENPKGKGRDNPPKGNGGMPPPPPPPDGFGTAPPPEPFPVPGFDFNKSVKQTGEEVQTVVQKEWAGLLKSVAPADFAHWPAVRAGCFLLGGLLAWMMYMRMVGAGRRAIREWREQHDPAT